MKIEQKIKEMGLTLPPPPKPAGSYIPISISNNTVYTSGMLPFEEGKLKHKGSFPLDLSIEKGQFLSKLCVLNALSAVKNAISDLDKIKGIKKLSGFIKSDKGFTDQAKILNGASDLLVEIFGEKGQHARSAIGVSELPLGSPIEIELIIDI
ncbi:RidA family protein [Candidatus Margulisiibacteriota bacterium]